MIPLEDAILRRWQQLKELGVSPKDRFNDRTIQLLEAQLKAELNREMAPIRAAIERRS